MARSPASTSKKTTARKPASGRTRSTPAANPKASSAAGKGTSDVPGSQEPDLASSLDLVMQLMAIRGGSGDEKDVAAFVV
ncbi:hypothetical protein EBU58_09165, partial [bacterium]|nr:hypothetical protein [bacterium]